MTHEKRPPVAVVHAVNKVLVVRETSHPTTWAAPAPLFEVAGLRQFRRHDVLSVVQRTHARSADHRVAGVDEIWTDAALPDSLNLVRYVYGLVPLVQVSAVREEVVFEHPRSHEAAVTRRLSLLQRKESLSRAAFSSHWEQVHAPMTRCHRHVARYVQNHVVGNEADDKGVFDGMADFEVGDAEGMESDYLTPEGVRMRADVGNFVATVSTYWVQTQEWRMPG